DGPRAIFGDAPGGKHSDDSRGRRVDVGLALISNTSGRWQPCAGAIATLPGREQTVPRGEIYAFVVGIERTSADVEFVTDHKPLLTAWDRQRWTNLSGGRDSDLWARVGRALAAQPNGRAKATRTPSHQGDDGEPIISQHLATGNCCADRLANLGVQIAQQTAAVSAPHADSWDVIASQIRRRARRALLGAAGGDPWFTERPAAESAAHFSRLLSAIDRSEHQVVALGQGKWMRLLCRQLFFLATLREAAAGPCHPSAIDWAFFDHVIEGTRGSPVAMGTGAIHSSLRIMERPTHSLFFCNVRGAYGTKAGMRLRAECKGTISRKSAEALKRMA
ncbi:unnamed protein product, partial [Prorocentrum cordatum]